MSISIKKVRKKKKNLNKVKELFRQYEEETGENPIYQNNITTLGFKIWYAKKEKLNNIGKD